MAAISHTHDVDTPKLDQLVTIWPMNTNDDARILNDNARNRRKVEKPCELAVDKYSIVTAKTAIADAEKAGARLDGVGPYILAWSPSSSKGKADALILIFDLSNVTSYPQAEQYFIKWSEDIEGDPNKWKGGWKLEDVRLSVRDWADKFGPGFLSILGG